ncbi:MAG: 6-bladed beta-propeller [Tannerella sp.]|jgi:hypothetical protein|nr:6-bladed beta-propeller [Tannerella sp.]
MKHIFGFLIILICLSACSGDKKSVGEVPVIDVISSVEHYQRVYCSDLFSSMELIPLETKQECLMGTNYTLKLKDSMIIVRSIPGMGGMIGPVNISLYAFDRSGNFINPIGRKGQGPEEYISIGDPFFNMDQPTLFVEDMKKVIEYDLQGNFIRSFKIIEIDSGVKLSNYGYVGGGLFIAKMPNNGKNEYNYCIMDEQGNFLKGFPNYIFFQKEREYASTMEIAIDPIRVDDQLYLKDMLNDTIYSLSNMELKPEFVFGFGQYSYPIEYMSGAGDALQRLLPDNAFLLSRGFGYLVGTPNFFFYRVRIPKVYKGPKSKQVYIDFLGEYKSTDDFVHGIYNIAQHTNILLDTEPFYLQKGIINDLNGGLSFIPKYYAGNGEVIDIWNPADMKEMLTDEYFASLKIKDPQAHQKLKELLKTLKEDDNPVVVVAKLK